MYTETIGKNIKSFREHRKMTQKDLAEKLNLARPVISNWENGKSEPSSSQLVRIAKIFEKSTDEILGLSLEGKRIVVVDTSALIKRPSFLNDLVELFDEIIIPNIVIKELNDLKDHGKSALRQTAWLVLSSIHKMKTEGNHRDKLRFETSNKSDGNNDEKIAHIGLSKAKANRRNQVFILTDDIYFQFLCSEMNNLSAITPNQLIRDLNQPSDKFDPEKSIEFCLMIETESLEQIKAYKLDKVDLNFHNPDCGLTPLIAAIRSRRSHKDKKLIVEHLLSHPNLDIDIRDKHKYYFSAIHHATQLKNLDLIKLLTKYGADIDLGSKGKNRGNTPLMISAWSGFKAGVQFFLEHGASPNQQDDNGFTPLFKACIKNDFEIIEILAPITDLTIRCRKNKKAIDYLDSKKIDAEKIKSIFLVGNSHDR